MKTRLQVMKFGGTSVAMRLHRQDGTDYREGARERCVAVVSAMTG